MVVGVGRHFIRSPFFALVNRFISIFLIASFLYCPIAIPTFLAFDFG
jgi:hypothetical protein